MLTSSGCNTAHKVLMEKKIEAKKKNYEALLKDLSNNKIQTGDDSKTFTELYGEPDNIIRSGSSVSTFEVWSYEKLGPDGKPDLWNPIRLYFNNSKLINWKY